MALEFSGIENIGEFYSGHYLTAVLEGDLKAVFKKWKTEKDEEGRRLPNEALGGHSNRYFTALGKAKGERDPLERLQLAMDFHAHLVEALGYARDPHLEALDNDEVVPVHLALRRDGNPFLWVLDAPFSENDDDDPLSFPPLEDQMPDDSDGARLPRSSKEKDQPATWREILDDRLFRIERPPRWILFLAGSEALLIERHKWPLGKYLRFDFGELLGRKQTAALRAMAGLLHKDVLAPEAGLCLHDTLDENSHKHAYAVSGDLKHGVRRAVELLANEAIRYRRDVQRKGVFNDEAFAAKLTSESLTWLYRLLFLFYVEARGSELGTVPMQADAYRKGYSLENLRDLELIPLTTEHARNGTFIHDSLRILFDILDQGFPDPAKIKDLLFENFQKDDLQVPALNSPLFDDERLELLKGVRFRNHVLQEILQLLSLSAEKKKKFRGRISYAQLGINQLGAVYEGLLSYTGFFAVEDLYEVAAEKDCKDLSGRPAAEREALKTYFVPASRIQDYREGEIVKDEHNKKVTHKKGAFIFRLAGRNREKSASYYTPEVLTRCLVKYALKELLWEEDEKGGKPKRKKSADEILALTLCEPAMGSSAFLIEAVDQLADAYLEARQEELGEALPPEDYQREKRRVKARLATNNCYGVDLNPTAVELAKVSLWLATLYEGGKCPWFGLRLATGNSLVGARREVFKTIDVIRKGNKDNPNWLGLVPEAVPLNREDEKSAVDTIQKLPSQTLPFRPGGTIYHFLLPAEGMAAFEGDKVVKDLFTDEAGRIKKWRTAFTKPLTQKEAARLEKISDAVDRLLAQVVKERVLAIDQTSDSIPVWGEAQAEKGSAYDKLLVQDQEEVARALEHRSSAYRRLKLAMDYWSALWFWPIEKAHLLPERATWLAQMELILCGEVSREKIQKQELLFSGVTKGGIEEGKAEKPLDEDANAGFERLDRLKTLSKQFEEQRDEYLEACGLADVEKILETDKTLREAQRLADTHCFLHWPLRFAEVFARNGGFDLIVGNPPWIKLQWQEAGVLSDFDARIEIRKISASETAKLRANVLGEDGALDAYFNDFVQLEGVQNFLNANQNYPLLKKVQTNLYKCFITRAWSNGSQEGVSAFLHPEGVYDDPKGGMLRRELYPRLAGHYQFINELRLFSEVDHHAKFSANIYQAESKEFVNGFHVSNLFHPSTLEGSSKHDGLGSVPGVKTVENHWDLQPHRNRIIDLDDETLALFASLYDAAGTSPLEARLPVVHSKEIVNVLRRFAEQPRKLGDLRDEYYATVMFDETYAQRDATIRRETRYPKDASEWILQGPHFYVGTPLYKTPNEGCSHNLDYTAIDLTAIPEDYLPRTNYVPACTPAEYARRTPKWKGKPVTDYYRHVNRRQISPTGERTLVSSIIPPGAAHVHPVVSATFNDLATLVDFASLVASIPWDFFLKTTGRGDLTTGGLSSLAFPSNIVTSAFRTIRILRLICVTADYRLLWERTWKPEYLNDSLCASDVRLYCSYGIKAKWELGNALHSDLARRQALLELDVLGSMVLNLRLDDLLTAYRVQFPVLQQYERERLYDQHGRIVPTSKTAAGATAVNLVELAAILKEQAAFDIHAEYHPNGPNTQELRKQKIRLGKKEADVLGVPERCTMADLLTETEVRWSDEEHPEGRPVPLVGLRYNDPGLEPRMERVYPTPWTRCDREEDYRVAWAEFERRLGKKMPEGTPL